jgi:hypothetical protein
MFLEFHKKHETVKTHSEKSARVVHPLFSKDSTFRNPSDSTLPTVVGFPLKCPRPPYRCGKLDENVETAVEPSKTSQLLIEKISPKQMSALENKKI